MNNLELDAKQAVSENLARIRKAKGFTQKDLELRIKSQGEKITQATLSRIENGEVWPDYATLVNICKALEVEHTEVTSHPDLLSAFKKLKDLK